MDLSHFVLYILSHAVLEDNFLLHSVAYVIH